MPLLRKEGQSAIDAKQPFLNNTKTLFIEIEEKNKQGQSFEIREGKVWYGTVYSIKPEATKVEFDFELTHELSGDDLLKFLFIEKGEDKFYTNWDFGWYEIDVADLADLERLGLLKDLLQMEHQIVLQGPPGTSKTYEAKRLAAYMLGFSPNAANKGHKDHPAFDSCRFTSQEAGKGKEQTGVSQGADNGKGCWEIVQFHPAYNYEDFVRGIQVNSTPDKNICYETKDKVFAELCKTAREHSNSKHILIIDEINRAHLAAVLGELIYALEYRGEEVRTPYAVGDDAKLMVPENLFVIGTMNTADRSIGHIDYAVRRRFAFYPLLPDKSVIESYYAAQKDLKVKALNLFEATEALFKVKEGNEEKPALSPEFHPDDVQVGHAYFLAENEDDLFRKFAYQVYPLLREYYKDGVLAPNAGELQLSIGTKNGKKKISISSHTSAGEILERLP